MFLFSFKFEISNILHSEDLYNKYLLIFKNRFLFEKKKNVLQNFPFNEQSARLKFLSINWQSFCLPLLPVYLKWSVVNYPISKMSLILMYIFCKVKKKRRKKTW